jgi:hypothetical protein
MVDLCWRRSEKGMLYVVSFKVLESAKSYAI